MRQSADKKCLHTTMRFPQMRRAGSTLWASLQTTQLETEKQKTKSDNQKTIHDLC